MTFSIVARDQKTGEVGVAVQSHFFSVGSIAAWASPGAGAMMTQASVDPRYGADAMKLLSSGMKSGMVLNYLCAARSAATNLSAKGP